MKIKKIAVLVGMGVAFSGVGVNAYAVTPWIGSADYTAAPTSPSNDEDKVGPFSTYDFGTGVVLLKDMGTVGSVTSYDGYYQSFVTKHELFGATVAAPKLDSTYELTAQATFSETVTKLSAKTSEILVTGGTFNLYFDTTPDRNFNTDSGFGGDDILLSGTILSGEGSATTSVVNGVTQVSGSTDLIIRIDAYNHSVFDPDTIVAGQSIFTLRLNNGLDAPFISPITSVMGVAYSDSDSNPLTGDLKFSADGNIALAVPEAETWAMMLAGLGLVGLQLRRKGKVTKEIAVN
jgi:hypothetical protein